MVIARRFSLIAVPLRVFQVVLSPSNYDRM